MPRKALRVVVELQFRAVSCPGVHLPAKDDVYLNVCFMGQYRKLEYLPAVFPLLFHEKMTFEKIFRHAVDPGDIAVMLEYETVKIELVQLIPPAGETLASFEEDARRFLFPEPRLVPSFSGVAREVLMTRAPHFPGIAPRLEFSTKTTISECSAYAEADIHPNVPLKPVTRKQARRSRKQKGASPQRIRPRTVERRRGGRLAKDCLSAEWAPEIPRSRSLSPLRASFHGNTQRLAQLSLGSYGSSQSSWDKSTSSEPPHQHVLGSWPGTSRSLSPHHAALTDGHSLTSSPPPFPKSPSTTGRHSPQSRRTSPSNGWVPGPSGEPSSSSDSDDHLERPLRPSPSSLWRSHRAHASHSRSQSASLWEEVQERVRGLLTTPKAVRRLVYGATVSEVDEVLARRSISPGPP